MIVCIAEKPSVASEIAKVIGASKRCEGYYEGNGYQVTWTFGHLCTLQSPDEYTDAWKRWSMDTLPMIPETYQIRLIDDAGVRKQFKVIKVLYQKADCIINCGDAGQEGELIQRYVMQLAGVRCPVKRLWISSLTEDAIREGFRHLRPQSDYDTLYQAGQARANGDWLLGMNATRLYTVKYGGYKQVLSIGRVQTPTLGMIVERDSQIEHFVPQPYWVLTTKYRDTVFSDVNGRFGKEQDAMMRLQEVTAKPFNIVDIQYRKGTEQPPQLYDLTALQVDCNKKYGMSAEVTLKTIQSLYEKKLTTYPRVDTKYLTDDIYQKCPDILKGLSAYTTYTTPLLSTSLPKSKRVFDSSKVTDHHAIIPTGEPSGSLNQYEQKVYDLVARRFISVFMPESVFATTTVLGRSASVDFKATGKTVLKEGWRAIYSKVVKDEDETDEKENGNENKTLPQFVKGEQGTHQPSLQKKMTTPPKRYTEATLLQSMETAGKFVEDESLRDAMKENGIGRPSSRAGIIETLLKRGYVVRERKNLVSTSTGRQLLDIIKSGLLKSPELTGRWEKKLREIEHGKYQLEQFMQELEQQLQCIIDEVKGDSLNQKVTITSSKPTTRKNTKGSGSTKPSSSKRPSSKANEGDRCPVCGKGIVRKGPYGLYCSEYKNSGCKWRGK